MPRMQEWLSHSTPNVFWGKQQHIPLFGICSRFRDRRNGYRRRGPDGSGPLNDSIRCPFQVLLVVPGPMLRQRRWFTENETSNMGGDAASLMYQLNG